ncbi:hypothetical protein Hamer_G027566 [Homarus americanus]|uniref:Uncharacterized protein n=1 Tax=Homarus americanus TaxID=6706 RepID=A0A8J5JTL5_HOMAM|nr:hypothetical protein Hamer_G027566 [Homarus americanus]
MLAISASGFLTNFLLGGPILGALKNNQLLLALQLCKFLLATLWPYVKFLLATLWPCGKFLLATLWPC